MEETSMEGRIVGHCEVLDGIGWEGREAGWVD